MKITGVETYIVKSKQEIAPWIIVQVQTDEGIVGWGDATNYPGWRTVRAAVRDASEVIIGQNPFDIERLWQQMYRQLYYVGTAGAVISAISGIEIALWDIVGKALGVPVYNLLGGKCNDPLPLYTHPSETERTPSAYVEACLACVEDGFRALKFDPFLRDRGMPMFQRAHLNRSIDRNEEDEAVEIVRAVRLAVGPKIGIALDTHAHFDAVTAIRLARRMDEFDLMFFEEPVPPENVDVMVKVAAEVNVPICTGERLFTRQGFRQVLEKQAADIIMPDVVRTGGILEMKKIAAMAEVYYVPVAPHNPNSPLSTLATSQVCANIPNFLIQEVMHENTVPWIDEVFTDIPLIVDGYLRVPTKPGIGCGVNLKAAQKYAAE